MDVREDLRSGREPFSKIMKAAEGLQSGDELLVIAPFQPVPLLRVLEKQGFSHTSAQIAAGDWEARFTRHSNPSPPDSSPSRTRENSSGFTPAKMVEVDARGLEPPQPMVKILEALAQLPDGGQLRALTDRRPMHLYAQLEARGYSAETQEQPDGSFLTHVRRC